MHISTLYKLKTRNQQIFLNLAVFAIAFIFKCAYYVKRHITRYITSGMNQMLKRPLLVKKTEIGGLILYETEG